MDLKAIVFWLRSESGWRPKVGCREFSNEPPGSIKGKGLCD